MFEKAWHESLQDRFRRADKEDEFSSEDILLLLRVELGLRFLEILDLPDEPVQSVWAWLTNLPLPDKRHQSFTSKQTLALANAPVLLQFGKLAWIESLKTYAAFPAKWRCYSIDPDNLAAPVVREPNGPTMVTDRLDKYDEYLSRPLVPYRLRPAVYAPVGKVYFRTTRRRPRTLMAQLDEPLISTALNRSFTRLPEQPWEKQPLSFTVDDLRRIAQELDRRENDRNIEPKGNWASLVDTLISYRIVHPGKSLGSPNSEPLQIQGLLHLAGMVGSGKSTLMKLLAAFGALWGGWRTTIVVGETLAAIDLADYFNQVLADPQTRLPIAVPLLGRTNRHVHLLKLFGSEAFSPDHYGLRWLDTRCPVQGTISAIDLQEGPLMPGDEPCERLYENEAEIGKYEKRRLCPLFSVCPAQQQYRDMSEALIWITTPGAMASSRLPTQMDQRNMRLGEVVYHQSRLVVFDEVDMVQQWFDHIYATDQRLLDSSGGSLDIIDQVTSVEIAKGYDISDYIQRWIMSVRRAREVGLQISTLLQRHAFLAAWVGQRYFTAYRLFASLSLLLAGGEMGNDTVTPAPEQVQKDLLGLFNRFHDDEIMPPPNAPLASLQPIASGSPLARLHAIADAILARTGSIIDLRTVEWCKSWVHECVPGIDQLLEELEKKTMAWERSVAVKRNRSRSFIRERPDDLSRLALRLELAVAVSVLERLVKITFDEWYSAPLFITSKVQGEQQLQRIPQDLVGVLPTAPTGSLFGFMYVNEELQADDAAPGEALPVRNRRLSVFQYHSIGRWYVLHFNHLLARLGYPGPNVLAMSGTSWLPDAAAWHLNVYPEAVLEPSSKSQRAIGESQFSFLPQYDEEGHPIIVSGSDNLEESVWQLTTELARTPTPQACPLRYELQWLEKEGANNPQWRDRQRLLLFVNSYDQVERVVAALIRSQRDWEEIVYGVARNDERHEDRWLSAKKILGQQRMSRGDIEGFARVSRGKILVAPLQSIGRGYNILNEENIAAFGSVYFLTRPMPQPYDMLARAAWMNRQTLDWCSQAGLKLWNAPLYADKSENLRKQAHDEWDNYEGGLLGSRGGYRYLRQDRKDDLAASMAGVIIQACGRLLRGGVPFHAYFVDAAWAPNSANRSCTEPDTPDESLLVGMIRILERYCQQDAVARLLYEPLVVALKGIKGLRLVP